MSGLVAIILGSVIGGAARYFMSGFVARKIGETFPWGTLIINVSGAFLIGLIGGLAKDSTSVFASPNIWLFAVPGIRSGRAPRRKLCKRRCVRSWRLTRKPPRARPRGSGQP